MISDVCTIQMWMENDIYRMIPIKATMCVCPLTDLTLTWGVRVVLVGTRRYQKDRWDSDLPIFISHRLFNDSNAIYMLCNMAPGHLQPPWYRRTPVSIDLVHTCTRCAPMSELILGLHQANERRRYFVTTSPIGWVSTQPCMWWDVIHRHHYALSLFKPKFKKRPY